MYRIVKSAEGDMVKLVHCYNNANLKYKESERCDITYEQIKEAIDGTQTYHIEEKEKTIGWISFRNDNENNILEGLYVRSEYQGKAIAKMLIEHYFDLMKNVNAKASLLRTLTNAPWAIKFYEKYGFQIIKEMTLDEEIDAYLSKSNLSFEVPMFKKY